MYTSQVGCRRAELWKFDDGSPIKDPVRLTVINPGDNPSRQGPIVSFRAYDVNGRLPVVAR
jgi:hypothetical protein